MTINPGTYDGLIIYKGATFDTKFFCLDACKVPVDLTGYTDGSFQAKYSLDDEDPFIDLNVGNDGVILGGEEGYVRVILSAADSAALVAGYGIYAIKLTVLTGDVFYVLQGNMQVKEMP